MRALLFDRITLIWFLLIAATALSWEFGHGLGFGDRYRHATVAVIVIAFIKVRYVFLDFMELRAAPLPLRLMLEAWAIGVGGAIIFLYWPGG